MTTAHRTPIKRARERRKPATEFGARRAYWLTLAISLVLSPTLFSDAVHFSLNTLEKVRANQARTAELSRSLSALENRVAVIERLKRVKQ